VNLSSPLSALNLSNRAMNALSGIGVKTVQQLVDKTVFSLSLVKAIGKTTIQDIQEKLAIHGLSLKGETISQIVSPAVEKMAREIYIGSLIRGTTQDCEDHFKSAIKAALFFEKRLFEEVGSINKDVD